MVHNAAAVRHVFGHTWTLALEEQFYIALAAAGPAGPTAGLVLLCVVLAVVSAMVRGGERSCSGTATRSGSCLCVCCGFALGGLLAVLLDYLTTRPDLLGPTRIGLGLTAAGALGYLVGGYLEGGVGFIGMPEPRIWGSTTFAFVLLFFGAIGLVATSSGHPALSPLRFGPLVYLGQISYGLYLYHYPIYWLVVGRVALPELVAGARGADAGASLAAAVLSWHLIERPILGLKDRFRYAGRSCALQES